MSMHTTDTPAERLTAAAEAARKNGFYGQARDGYVSVSIVDLETVLHAEKRKQPSSDWPLYPVGGTGPTGEYMQSDAARAGEEAHE